MQLDNRFFGTWVCSDTFGSEVEVDIQEIEGKYVIDVLDHYDKEGGVVSDIEWDGTLLKFTTKWSSTNHICKRVLRLIDNDTVDSSLAYFEAEIILVRK